MDAARTALVPAALTDANLADHEDSTTELAAHSACICNVRGVPVFLAGSALATLNPREHRRFAEKR